jgi:hypothetical protein
MGQSMPERTVLTIGGTVIGTENRKRGAPAPERFEEGRKRPVYVGERGGMRCERVLLCSFKVAAVRMVDGGDVQEKEDAPLGRQGAQDAGRQRHLVLGRVRLVHPEAWREMLLVEETGQY